MGRLRMALWCATAVFAAACNPLSGSAPTRTSTVLPSGAVIIARDARSIEVSDPFGLERGDVVRTNADGTRVQFGARRLVLLGPDSSALVVAPGRVELLEGRLLTAARERIEILVDGATASALGVARFERSTATASAALYRGALDLSAPGHEPVEVRELFGVTVSGGSVVTPRPYRPDGADPWDRLYFAEALELDDEIDRFENGFRTGGIPAGLDVDESALRSHLDDHRLSDVLAAVAVARAAPSRRGPGVDRALALYDAGGSWGVVAMLTGADPARLLAELEEIALAAGADAPAVPPAEPDGARPPDCDNVIDCLLEDSIP
jgi:hypothetical protein